jgi:hypothetical protein
VLDAVFADIHAQPFSVIRPGATGAVETAVFMIHTKNCFSAFDYLLLLKQYARHAKSRAPGRRRVAVILLRKLWFAFQEEIAKTWLAISFRLPILI